MVKKKENQVEIEDQLEEGEIPADDNTDDVVEEDSDSTDGMSGMHKTNVLSVAMHKLGKMSKSELVDFYNQSMASIGHEADSLPAGATKEHNQGSLKMHPSAASALKESIKEDLAAVFGDNKDLTEEFKDKMVTLFESAVGARMVILESELTEAHEQAIQEEVQEIAEALYTQVDSYLNYITETWLEQNEVAIQTSLQSEITSEFMTGLRDLFLQHNVLVPEEKQDMVEMLCTKVEEQEAQLNELLSKNMELSERVAKNEREALISQVAEGLNDLNASKFHQLCEGVDCDDPEKFVADIQVVKEAHFGTKTRRVTRPVTTGLLTEEIDYDANDKGPEKPIKPEMRGYVKAIQKTIPGYLKSQRNA